MKGVYEWKKRSDKGRITVEEKTQNTSVRKKQKNSPISDVTKKETRNTRIKKQDLYRKENKITAASYSIGLCLGSRIHVNYSLNNVFTADKFEKVSTAIP